MGKKRDASGNPFAARRAELEAVAKRTEEAPKKQAAPAPADAEPPRELTDEEVLAEAYAGVQKLDPAGRVEPPREDPLTGRWYDEDAVVMNELGAMVDGSGEFDSFPYGEEAVRWAASDTPPDVLPRLVHGEFPIHAHIDLHGLNREAAREALKHFLRRNVHAEHICLLVVHGRGKGSADGKSVLKQAVHGWLRRGELSKYVYAYATATKHDGGAGATYVLLRT